MISKECEEKKRSDVCIGTNTAHHEVLFVYKQMSRELTLSTVCIAVERKPFRYPLET